MRYRYIILITWCLTLVVAITPVRSQQTQEQLAAYYYDRGEYEQAAQLYESLYKSPTTSKYYYQRLLSTYTELGRFNDAERLVSARRKANPKDLYLYVDEGTLLMKQKKEKKALKLFDKAIDAIGANLQPIPELAQAFLNIGRTDYAAQAYLTARAKTGNRYLYFNELCGVYQLAGNYDAMTAEYFELIDKQPSMMNNVQIAMQKALAEAPDGRLADGVRRELVRRVQEHPENKNYLQMMLWFSLQMRDFSFALEQAEAIDARFPDIGAAQVLQVAQIAQHNDALDVAADGYRYLQGKGPKSATYMPSRIGELEVAYAKVERRLTTDSKSLTELQARYLATFDELGKNERTIPLMRNYAALTAYHGGDPQAAINILDDVLALPKLQAHVRDEVKLELADMLLFAGQTWDASLLYMQVDKANKDDILGAIAKYRNARLSYFNHDFEWANSQLKALRSSTSKLIANDAMELSLLISDNMDDDSSYTTLSLFADADLLMYRGMLDSAWHGFDNITRQALSHPVFDEVLMRKAEIRMKQGRYEEADSLYRKVTEFYPDDITADDALMMRAKLNEEHLSNSAVAKECYERLLLDYPSSLYTDEARKRYNALIAR